jgi:Archaeal fructose-1,6-bisphosphatase and related enzymes of inositol monophosphatase family
MAWGIVSGEIAAKASITGYCVFEKDRNTFAMIRSPIMTVMTDAVMKAARSLKRDFGEVENLQVSRKGPGDFVSAADHKAESILRDLLEKARPGYGFVMEEQGVIEGTDKSHCWHIDPLDGTTNFLHGVPQFAISVGLEREGQVVAGVIYDPIKDELFIAERGKGAFMNNRRLRVASRRDVVDALISCGLPHVNRGDHRQFLRELATIMPISGGMRRFGSAALDMAYVACGRSDAYWERNINSWDMAAGIILIREAGGFVSDADGGDNPFKSRSVACGNEYLHRELVKLLAEANKPA